jgi:tetraprenyl-beta-curcumene synthase
VTAFQTVFDYLDLLAEQPTRDPIRNGRQLHQALLMAIDPWSRCIDYYAYHSHHADGGYAWALVSACRDALETLPSHKLVLEPLRRAANRIVDYQSYNHGDASGSRRLFQEWAQDAKEAYSSYDSFLGLRWWEFAAAAGSSMPVFALIAAAANAALCLREVNKIERSYYPRIAALNSLLDSLVDQQEDAVCHQNQLLAYYRSPQEAIDRLQTITAHVMRDVQYLPRAEGHTLILAALIGFYLSSQDTTAGHPSQAQLLDAIGWLGAPTMFVFRARLAIDTAKRALLRPHDLIIARVRRVLVA